MKKIITLILAVMLLASSAMANGLLILSPEDTTPEREAERQALLESLSKGIIPVEPGMSYDDFLSYMKIIDNSEGKADTAQFNYVISLISAYYYENLTMEQVFARFTDSVDGVDINDMEGTYKALFSTLDKFSYFLNPEESEDLFAPTKANGIGIKMVENSDAEGIYIVDIAKGSSAEKGGMQIGDRVVKYNGYDLRGLSMAALSAYIDSVDPAREELELTVERDGAEIDYVLPFGANLFDEYEMQLFPEKKLIYLDINSFMYDNTAADIGVELDAAWDLGYDNIIIDLRGNPGGNVAVAAELLSKFTEKTELLFFAARGGAGGFVPFVSMGNGHDFNKIYILVDGDTASSAETFTQVLNKLDDAEIVGTTTFGKGVAQSVGRFPNGSAIGITTYVMYDMEGETFNEAGIEPEHHYLPRVERYTLPRLPYFTTKSYKNAVYGAENQAVDALEERLYLLGFISESENDGKWNDVTTRALEAFQLACGYEPTGTLDEDTYFSMHYSVKALENRYYVTLDAFDYAYRFIPFSK